MMDNQRDNLKGAPVGGPSQNRGKAARSDRKPERPGPATEVQVASALSPRLRSIRETAFRAIDSGDVVYLVYLFNNHPAIVSKVMRDHFQEQQRLGKQNVDRDARSAAAEQCEVEIGNDPKSHGQFGDKSGDYVIEPVAVYGE